MLVGCLGVLIAASGFLQEIPESLRQRLAPTNEVAGVFVQTKTLASGEKFVSSGCYRLRPRVDFEWRYTEPFEARFLATDDKYEYSNEDETISRPLRQLPGFSNFAELRDGNFAGLMEAFESKYKEENGRHFLLSMPRAARLRKFLERIELEIDSTNIEIKATFKDKTTFKAKLLDLPAAKAD